MTIQGTLSRRRRIIIDAFQRHLSMDSGSASAHLAGMLKQKRPMAVSADIDGLVSAAMLASVTDEWEIVAFVKDSAEVILHPSVVGGMPADLVAVDLFSPTHDSLSNHIVKWGKAKIIALPHMINAFNTWDAHVDSQAKKHMFALPTMWTGTEAGRGGDANPLAARYRYPFGTAQFLLAMLEVTGHAPKFFERHYLPWLVAACDGGVRSYTRHSYNARVWWSIMAGAVGPASLSEQIYRLVDGMRPTEFQDVTNALDRERAATLVKKRGQPPAPEPAWLDGNWNLANGSPDTLVRCLTWLEDLTGWRSPVKDGALSIQKKWVTKPVNGSGIAAIKGAGATTPATETQAVHAIVGATSALNANFYLGATPGDRFNWVGGW